MDAIDRPPKNGFVARARKVYNPIGFSKGYNFILWFIFDGALLGFTLSRLPYLDLDGVFCSAENNKGLHAAPGDCYWYQSFRRNNLGIIIHLATILPASLLAVLQFVPAIRHKAILYHRMAGYVIILLTLVSNGSALVISNHAMGGDAATRTMLATLVVATTTSLGLAYYNIKKLQIDQHRAWMLRAWFYFASIITLRILMVIMANIASGWPDATMHVAMPCAEILSIFNGNNETAFSFYPACRPNATEYLKGGLVLVTATFGSDNPTEIAASLDSWFGPAGWIALALHAAGVEIYLHLTPRESQRLRQVSYERQLERGMRNAGFAGLVHDRIGDSEPWVPTHPHKQRLVNTLNSEEPGQSPHGTS